MIRRMLAAAGMAGLAVMLSGAVAWAAPGERGGYGAPPSVSAAKLMPLSGEWRFTSWKILPRVWPLTEGADDYPVDGCLTFGEPEPYRIPPYSKAAVRPPAEGPPAGPRR